MLSLAVLRPEDASFSQMSRHKIAEMAIDETMASEPRRGTGRVWVTISLPAKHPRHLIDSEALVQVNWLQAAC